MNEIRQAGPQAAQHGADGFSELCRKIVLLVAEDRLALAHFRQLIGLLKGISHAMVVVTRSTGRLDEIEALGVRVIDFDYRRSSGNPARGVAAAWAIGRILEAEDPDVVHLVGLEPAIVGGLALKLLPSRRVVVQMAGLGSLDTGTGPAARLYRAGALRLMASILRHPSSCLLLEDADDLAHLRASGVDPGARFAILAGSGVDPQAFPDLPVPRTVSPTAAFVGRISLRSGIDVLMQSFDLLRQRNVELQLELCGTADAEANGMEIAASTVAAWCAEHKAQWLEHAASAKEVWYRGDICVLPLRAGGGLPRAMLEAAACARPLIVTDVPGCRQFVRNGVEGLVVPPEDAQALAGALERLARDPDARQRMGEAARLRLLHGFTEAHVEQSLKAAYASMLGRPLGA